MSVKSALITPKNLLEFNLSTPRNAPPLIAYPPSCKGFSFFAKMSNDPLTQALSCE